jgi:hypothetical protein
MEVYYKQKKSYQPARNTAYLMSINDEYSHYSFRNVWNRISTKLECYPSPHLMPDTLDARQGF